MIAIIVIEIISALAVLGLASPFASSYSTTAVPYGYVPVSPSILFSSLLLAAFLLPLVMEIIMKGKQRKPSRITWLMSSILRTLFAVIALALVISFVSPVMNIFGGISTLLSNLPLFALY